jgi:thioredoxin 1
MSDSDSVSINRMNFEDQVLHSAVPVLLDFWADWCTPCKALSPILDDLGAAYAGRIKIGKVNIVEEEALAERHGIVSIPTLILYKNGVMADMKIGAAPRHDLETMIKKYI